MKTHRPFVSLRGAAAALLLLCLPLLALPPGRAEEPNAGDTAQSLDVALDNLLNKLRSDLGVTNTAGTAPTAAGGAAPAARDDALRVRPGLLLNVVVSIGGEKEIEELNKRVSASGDVALSLLGHVPVAGKTLPEVSEDLTRRYKEFIREPRVEVTFAYGDTEEERGGTSPWGSVTVLGRVKAPGRVGIPPTRDLTLSMAIQAAGGFDTSARQKAIRVTRKDERGAVRKFKVDMRAVATRGENDFPLQDGDVIYVPESLF